MLAAAAGVWLVYADDIPEPPPRPSPAGFFSTPRRVLDELRHERRRPTPTPAPSTDGREEEVSPAPGPTPSPDRPGLSRPGP